MNARGRTTTQFPINLEADIGDWARQNSGLGVSKAHILRVAMREGFRILEAADNMGELLVEEPFSRHKPGYEDRATLQLEDDDVAWIAGVHESTGVNKSTVIRVSLRLGRVVVDKRKRAAAGIDTDIAA